MADKSGKLDFASLKGTHTEMDKNSQTSSVANHGIPLGTAENRESSEAQTAEFAGSIFENIASFVPDEAKSEPRTSVNNGKVTLPPIFVESQWEIADYDDYYGFEDSSEAQEMSYTDYFIREPEEETEEEDNFLENADFTQSPFSTEVPLWEINNGVDNTPKEGEKPQGGGIFSMSGLFKP